MINDNVMDGSFLGNYLGMVIAIFKLNTDVTVHLKITQCTNTSNKKVVLNNDYLLFFPSRRVLTASVNSFAPL